MLLYMIQQYYWNETRRCLLKENKNIKDNLPICNNKHYSGINRYSKVKVIMERTYISNYCKYHNYKANFKFKFSKPIFFHIKCFNPTAYRKKKNQKYFKAMKSI